MSSLFSPFILLFTKYLNLFF